jgi:hypothetical protein
MLCVMIVTRDKAEHWVVVRWSVTGWQEIVGERLLGIRRTSIGEL